MPKPASHVVRWTLLCRKIRQDAPRDGQKLRHAGCPVSLLRRQGLAKGDIKSTRRSILVPSAD